MSLPLRQARTFSSGILPVTSHLLLRLRVPFSRSINRVPSSTCPLATYSMDHLSRLLPNLVSLSWHRLALHRSRVWVARVQSQDAQCLASHRQETIKPQQLWRRDQSLTPGSAASLSLLVRPRALWKQRLHPLFFLICAVLPNIIFAQLHLVIRALLLVLVVVRATLSV